jgi:hypothetical protein
VYARKAIEPHSSSRLVICRIFGLLARIGVVVDMFSACQDVPKGCALVRFSSCGISLKSFQYRRKKDHISFPHDSCAIII